MIHLTSLAAVLLLASAASAWNGPGHQTIDLIAWGQLNEDDRARAVSLLKDHPRFDQHFLGRVPDRVWKGSPGERDQWVFAFAGTWPDLVRSRSDVVTNDDAKRFNRSRWHYINLPIFPTSADRDALRGTLTNNRETKPPDDPDDDKQNVVQAIASSLRVLRDGDATRGDRAVALCWVLHLVGDSHQPCHSSALFTRQRFAKGDRGGNSIPLRYGGSNLHALWDQSILPNRSDFARVRRKANELATAHAEVSREAAASLKPRDWLIESWKLARSTAYTPSILEAVAAAEGQSELERIELPPGYLRAAGDTSQVRAVEAGNRLAELLRDSLPDAAGGQRPIVNPEASTVDLDLFTPAPAQPGAESSRSHWLNTKSNARHNRSCRWFGKTKAGRYCDADDGKACGQCGG